MTMKHTKTLRAIAVSAAAAFALSTVPAFAMGGGGKNSH